jgi:hypothetical protein
VSSTHRDAQERVATYYESCLRDLIGHVGIALDRYRADGDAEQMNTALNQYHRAARELWKFCWADGGGSHLEFVASLIDDSARRRTGGSAAHHDAPSATDALR